MSPKNEERCTKTDTRGRTRLVSYQSKAPSAK